MRYRIFIILIIFFLPYSGRAQEKYWIFFKDKGFSKTELPSLLQQEKQHISKKALQRREKVTSVDRLITEDDLPLNPDYLNEIKTLDIHPIVQSRWLNAISAYLSENQIDRIQQLSFVSNIKPVSRYVEKLPPRQVDLSLSRPQNYILDYGPSLAQNEIMEVPKVHELGLDGSGVMVGMLDTGFDYKYHDVFSYLRVQAEYDFINNDSTTQNEEDDNDVSGQHNHGTQTLSVIGGFKEGELIGPAFGATYLLAKTEYIPTETPVEEDYWVAGLEWLERQGADVVNSSLGYLDWYTYSDMDGKTAVTTIAADKAVEKGVVVVNSMGNEGNKSWHYMIAPADGFNVISVGAVYETGDLVGFSSRGPTYDGRIKPDVVSMGERIYTAQPSTVDLYRTSSGTSFSSPLVAGVAALILQAHPYLTPFQVREALRETADRSQAPDNDYGWGLVNAYEAIFYYGLFFSRQPVVVFDEQQGHLVKIKIFSKYDLVTDSLFVYYSTAGEDFYRLPLSASENQFEYQAWLPLQNQGTEIKCYFSARDMTGDFKLHPYRAPESYFTFSAFDTTVSPVDPPQKFRLYQNFPNPFDKYTKIEYYILTPGRVTLAIYNISGQLVRKLVDEEYHQQRPYPYYKSWDGRDKNGRIVASGIYFYRLRSGGFSAVKRMVFLRGKK